MVSRIYSSLMLGFKPVMVEIEAVAKRGVPQFVLIGLPSRTVAEAKERLVSALSACGIKLKARRVVVNLAPAEIKKTSSSLELGMAVALLKIFSKVEIETDDCLFLGELALDGQIKPIRGALSLVIAAGKFGFNKVVVPEGNLAELSLVQDVAITPVGHLKEVIGLLESKSKFNSTQFRSSSTPQAVDECVQNTFSQIVGQEQAKRALAIAAAGAHHLLLIGAPGSGKTKLAQALISLLPPMSHQEQLEATQIQSLVGINEQLVVGRRPFRTPHHTISLTGLIGGGRELKPGEISLAHHGVLFLDELPQFGRRHLDALREPLESGEIKLTRAIGTSLYPAHFTLIAAANPCLCGYYNSGLNNCSCTARQRQQYLSKLSGPLRDRLDLLVWVKPVAANNLASSLGRRRLQDYSVLIQQIAVARERQRERLKKFDINSNAKLSSHQLKQIINLSSQARQFLVQASDRLGLSARGFYQVLKVALTIADLAEIDEVGQKQVAEALSLRQSLS